MQINIELIKEYFAKKGIHLARCIQIAPEVDQVMIVLRFKERQKFRYHPIMVVTEVDFHNREVTLTCCTETFNNYYKSNARRPQYGN